MPAKSESQRRMMAIAEATEQTMGGNQ